MSHATVHMHEKGSFGSTYASALVMTNPTMNNRRTSSSSIAGETNQHSVNQQRVGTAGLGSILSTY